MEKSAQIWFIQGIAAILLWIAGIILWIFIGFFWITAGLLALHLSELLLIGYKVGTSNKYSLFETIGYVMLFGYIWWVPVKKGIYTKKNNR